MKTMRHLFLLSLFLSVFSASGFAAEGQYYTKINIWYEKPSKIMSTNYHKGAMIPVGTEVEIEKSNAKKIELILRRSISAV